MSRFEERNLVINPNCSTCKHCMASKVENDDGYAYTPMWTKVYHCMLDVPRRDIKFVKREIDSYVGYSNGSRFTEAFNQIMELNSEARDEQYLEDSARLVEPNNCCQFYENKYKENRK